MTDIALAPTPAQERMAQARADRAARRDAVSADIAEALAPDIVAQAAAQRAAKEAEALATAQADARREAASKGIVAAPTRGELAGQRAEQAALAREDAARAALNPPAADVVTVRVLKAGNNKISKGVHVGGIGDAHYERGDEFEIARDIAVELEDIGRVEIQP